MPLFKFNLHRENAVQRRVLLFRVVLLVLVGWSGLVACGDDGSGRYAYHVARSRGIFGATQRITVQASAGVVRACEDSGDQLDVCVRMGSPFPTLRVANGNLESAEAIVRLSNVPADGAWEVYLEPLLPDESQDQRCARDGLGPPPGSSTRLADDEGQTLIANVQGCGALVFVSKPAAWQADEVYRIAVLGGASLREGELRTFLQQLAQRVPSPDFVYFLDDVNIRNSTISLEELDEMMQEVGLRWSMVMSPRSLGRGYEPFVDRLGSLDYYTRIHGIPLIVLDTANARVSNTQRGALKSMRICHFEGCASGLALMSIPPVGTHSVDVGIFRSQVLAQDLLSLLTGIGIRAIASSAEEKSDSKVFSRLRLLDVGTFDDRDDFLEASFFPAATGAQLCDNPLTLQDDSRWTVSSAYTACGSDEECYGGVCLETCEVSEDCSQPHHLCSPEYLCREPCGVLGCSIGTCGDDGFCEVGPMLKLRRREL